MILGAEVSREGDEILSLFILAQLQVRLDHLTLHFSSSQTEVQSDIEPYLARKRKGCIVTGESFLDFAHDTGRD